MFDLTQCLNAAALVTGCPTEQICVKDCPSETFLADDKKKMRMKPYCKANKETDLENKSVEDLVKEEICPKWVVESEAILGRCFPLPGGSGDDDKTVVVETGEKNVTQDDLDTATKRLGVLLFFRQTGEKVFADLKETRWLIGIALIGACLLSFIWIILMRYVPGVMVWGSILIVFLGTAGALGYSGYRYHFAKLDSDPQTDKNLRQANITPEFFEDILKQSDTWLAFTVILGILFLVIICLFIFLRKVV